MGAPLRARLKAWQLFGGRGQPILLRADEIAVLGSRRTLYARPFLIRHEGRPGRGLRGLVGPFEKVNKLGAFPLRLPHCQNTKAVAPHDAGRVVAELRVKSGLVVLEDLVDAELMNHGASL